jgi:hypothetical protein
MKPAGEASPQVSIIMAVHSRRLLWPIHPSPLAPLPKTAPTDPVASGSDLSDSASTSLCTGAGTNCEKAIDYFLKL